MRKSFIGSALALIAGLAVVFPVRASKRSPAPPVEPRRSALAQMAPSDGVAARFALAASLWCDRMLVQCRAPASWGAEPVSATFGAVLRFSVRDAIAAQPVVGVPGWRFGDQLVVTSANDADVAARVAQIEPGLAPVVRVLRRASFRPRRVTFGRAETLAA